MHVHRCMVAGSWVAGSTTTGIIMLGIGHELVGTPSGDVVLCRRVGAAGVPPAAGTPYLGSHA